MKRVDDAGGPDSDAIKTKTESPANELVEKIERSLMLAYLMGMGHAAPSIELADEIKDIPFESALEYMEARVPLTKAEWLELEPKLRFRAFTVAALSQVDNIEQVKNFLAAAIKSGKSFSEFWTEASAIDSAGLGAASPWYWETVYRNNLQTAYNTGRAAELQKTKSAYLELIGISDARQTEICRKVTGTILPSDHEFWKTYWPPLHHGCRDTVRSVSQEEIDAKRKANPEWEPTKDIPTIKPDKGFGGYPLETGSYWELTGTMADRANKYGLMPAIVKFANLLGLKVKFKQK